MIIPVKKIRIITQNSNVNHLLDFVYEDGRLMPLNNLDDQVSSDEWQSLKNIEMYIEILGKYTKKKFFEHREVSVSEFKNIEHKAQLFLSNVSTLYQDKEKLSENIQLTKQKIKVLQPFETLEVTTKDLESLTKTTAIIGSYKTTDQAEIIEKLSPNYLETIKVTDDQTYVVIICEDDPNILQNKLGSLFTEIKLPILDIKVADELYRLNELLLYYEQTIVKNDLELKKLSEDLDILRTYYDYTYNKALKDKIEISQTESVVYFEGWIPEDQIADLKEKCINDFHYEIEVLEVNEEEKVPTYTRNNKVVKQFETITNMFSVPDPNEIDPNPVMSIWYWFIFGIMMGDIGYGLMMIIFFTLFIKFKKPKGEFKKLIYVFAYSGVSAIIFGILFGSFFGVSVDLLNIIGKIFGQNNWSSIVLEPVNEPLPMLIFSLAIGILHIITGLIIKTILEFRRKNIYVALSQSISWILILVGIVLAVLIKPLWIGLSLVIIGVVFILVFSGHDKKGIFGKAMSGLGGIYGVTNYLSDILSYSRILALSLSSAVIAFTMNMLAQMVSGSFIGFFFAIIIYIVGHVFNFAMGLLSAYVHDGRLQYLEFFGKFYEGGGTEFIPLEYKLKYIDEIKENI